MKPVYRQIDQMPHPLNRILQIARSLLEEDAGEGSTRDRIAAAFVVERMDCLPYSLGVLEAWEYLGVEWQFYVRHLQQDYRCLVEALVSESADRETQ